MEQIKTHPMVSSNIARAGYDEKKKILEIHFKNGGIYRYDGVPKYIYEGIFKDQSPGGFLRKWVINGRYKTNKVIKK